MNIRLVIGLALVGLIVLAGVAVSRIDPIARTGSGYIAKIACSEVFVAGRDPAAVMSAEFKGIDPALERVSVKFDIDDKTVATSLFGMGRSRAVYREGYGCTLAGAGEILELPALPGAGAPDDRALIRSGNAALEAVFDAAMADASAGHRALLAMRGGEIIGERYAEGFGPDTRMLSWSMAKSVTADMVGAAVLRGVLDIDDAPPVPEWREADDPRRAITWRDLLRMESGLAFDESYGAPMSDVNRMLFQSADTGGVAADQPAAAPPGEVWAYSSGTTNLIQRALRTALTEAGIDYHRFPRGALFGPLGASSAVLEPDASGVFVGSSFLYATARDWARLGQLHLQDGVWQGVRLLPEGWTDFVRTPVAASDNEYGGQFWLNLDGLSGRGRRFPELPASAFMMSGHEGQYVVMMPDEDIVLVRLGQTRGAIPFEVAGPVLGAMRRAIVEAPDATDG